MLFSFTYTPRNKNISNNEKKKKIEKERNSTLR